MYAKLESNDGKPLKLLLKGIRVYKVVSIKLHGFF